MKSIRWGLLALVCGLASYGSMVLAAREPTTLDLVTAAAPAQSDKPSPGLAAKYPDDQGLEKDADVLIFWNYEDADSWKKGWSNSKLGFQKQTTEAANVFRGKGALEQARLAKTNGPGYQFRLKEKNETCLYQRFYAKIPMETKHGFKFHGFAGAGPDRPDWYPVGSAGTRPDGEDKFLAILMNRYPVKGQDENTYQAGFYYYHLDQKDGYGDGNTFGPSLKRGDWHCFEYMVKLNDVGEKNGEMKCWIDGKLASEITGLRWRTSQKLPINLLIDHMYSNAKDFPEESRIYIDNRVVARKYIGPIAPKKSAARKPDKP